MCPATPAQQHPGLSTRIIWCVPGSGGVVSGRFVRVYGRKRNKCRSFVAPARLLASRRALRLPNAMVGQYIHSHHISCRLLLAGCPTALKLDSTLAANAFTGFSQPFYENLRCLHFEAKWSQEDGNTVAMMVSMSLSPISLSDEYVQENLLHHLKHLRLVCLCISVSTWIWRSWQTTEYSHPTFLDTPGVPDNFAVQMQTLKYLRFRYAETWFTDGDRAWHITRALQPIMCSLPLDEFMDVESRLMGLNRDALDNLQE